MSYHAAPDAAATTGTSAPETPLGGRVSIVRLWLAGVLFFLGFFFSVLAYLDGQKLAGAALILLALASVAYLAIRNSQSKPLPLVRALVPVQSGLDAEAVVSAFPEPAVVLSDSFFVQSFNAAAQQLFPNIQKGKPLSFAVRVPEILNAIRQAKENRTATVDYSERVPKDLWVQVHAARIDADSQTAILLTLKDLTSIRQAEKTRADFVANASHELRTPLASLLGFIDTLQGAAKDDAVARDRFLNIMREQSRRMARLVDDLLSLSHLEQKAHQKPQGEASMREVVTQVRDGLQPLAAQKGVELVVNMEDNPYRVTGDRDELLRVMENLVENAIKYGGDGKKVEIAIQHKAGAVPEVEISVRDFGQGIAADHIPRLTERFYRADADAVINKSGTGLGLAIVKHILTRHNGRLHIESLPGKGSLFAIALPAKEQDNIS